MKQLLFSVVLLMLFPDARAQDSRMHSTSFKRKPLMSSKPYQPQDWEKKLFDTAVKTAFPADLLQAPERYQGRMIHLVGVLDKLVIDTNGRRSLSFELDNHYWDYIEDYSVQDEVMFVSPEGGGRFRAGLSDVTPGELAQLETLLKPQSLVLVYGRPAESADGVATLDAVQIRVVDPFYYSTAVFSYQVARDPAGNVRTTRKGLPQLTDFHVLRPAGKGQNK